MTHSGTSFHEHFVSQGLFSPSLFIQLLLNHVCVVLHRGSGNVQIMPHANVSIVACRTTTDISEYLSLMSGCDLPQWF